MVEVVTVITAAAAAVIVTVVVVVVILCCLVYHTRLQLMTYSEALKQVLQDSTSDL